MSNSGERTQGNRGAPRSIPNALDPRTPALVQPFKRLVDEGFIALTAKFTSTTVEVVGVPDARMIIASGGVLEENRQYAVAILARVAEEKNLIPLRGKSKVTKQEQPLPKKSLCLKDFDSSPQEFRARAMAVADACGGKTLIGRVRSAGAFDGHITTSFQKWWDEADYECRALSLMFEKNMKEVPENKLKALANLQCPFRGPAEFVVQQEAAPTETRAPTPPAAKNPVARQASSPPKN